MTSTRYYFGASHEEFPPEALLEQAVAAERACFEGISASDHLQPWWEPGESGHTWVWLGAAGQATERIPLGTGVTPTGAGCVPPAAGPRSPTWRRGCASRARRGSSRCRRSTPAAASSGARRPGASAETATTGSAAARTVVLSGATPAASFRP